MLHFYEFEIFGLLLCLFYLISKMYLRFKNMRIYLIQIYLLPAIAMFILLSPGFKDLFDFFFLMGKWGVLNCLYFKFLLLILSYLIDILSLNHYLYLHVIQIKILPRVESGCSNAGYTISMTAVQSFITCLPNSSLVL